MTALQIVALVVGIAVAILLTNWLNMYVFWLVAVIGGIAGGIVVYQLIVKYVKV